MPESLLPAESKRRFTLTAAVVLALTYVACLPWHPWPGSFVLKCAPIVLLAGLAATALAGKDRLLLVIALLTSAAGDVLLDIDRGNLFVFGMGAFLVTQVCYTTLFLSRRRLSASAWPIIGLVLLVNLVLLPRYWSAAPDLAVPGVAYLLALSVMTVCAAASTLGNAVRAGALLFFISDHLIASNEFLGGLPLASYPIMLSYYGAQLLITTGVLANAGDKRPEDNDFS
jgi:uncharacterized membrane protein YhhN